MMAQTYPVRRTYVLQCVKSIPDILKMYPLLKEYFWVGYNNAVLMLHL